MVPTLVTADSRSSRRRRSVADVADELRSVITGGAAHPNERLIEEDLARRFGTNRAVVRGALAILTHEGLVVRERNRGARVREVGVDEAVEMLEARAVLEGIVARRAAERFGADARAELEALVSVMRRHRRDGDLLAYSEKNARFHRALIALAGHAAAEKLLALLQSQSVRYHFRTVLQPGRIDASLAEHEAILAALTAGDPDAAETAARRHVAAVIAAVRSLAHARRAE